MWGALLLGSVLLGSLAGPGAAVAQESSRGSLFPKTTTGSGASSGASSGTTGSTLFPSDILGTSAPLGGGLPADLLLGKAQGAGEAARRGAPVDPLRGLVLTPEQLRPVAPSEYRAPAAQAERVRQAGAGGSKPSSHAAAPADPLRGLVNDSDQLLQFSSPKTEAAASPEASTFKADDGGSLFRMNRSPTPTGGIAVPDLTGGNLGSTPGGNPATAMALPNASLTRSGMSNTAPDIATFELGAPSSSGGGGEKAAGQTYRAANTHVGDDMPRQKPQYSLPERVVQLFLGALEQPLSYVLLIGVCGFFVAVKLRRA